MVDFVLQSYTMRNGVLGILGEILLKVLSKEDLEEKMKDARDQFLEKLEVSHDMLSVPGKTRGQV